MLPYFLARTFSPQALQILRLTFPACCCYINTKSSPGMMLNSAVVSPECYQVLNVSHNSNAEEVRQAYLDLAKKLHPDSGLKTADTKRFSRVQDAYHSIMRNLQQQQQSGIEKSQEEEEMKDREYMAPQHRQYLSFDGIGSGNPSKRERQYRQHRVMRAAEKVYQYKIDKYGETDDTAMVVKDKKATRRRKISNAIDRVVEDLIQDAMSKGEFHNLPGSGKPLSFKEASSMLDVNTHNLNRVLINNGYTPEWIVMRKEIREHVINLRHTFAVICLKGDKHLYPYAVDKFNTGILDINIQIDKYNLIVPILNKQMFHYNSQREMETVLKNPQLYLKLDFNGASQKTVAGKDAFHSDPISWSQVWKDIKAVFK